MPYKSEKIKLSKEQDRRIKLTEEQRQSIKNEYASGLVSQRELARKYNVSRRLISFVLDEKKAEIVAQQLKERRKDGRYKPPKEEWAAIIREHRRYKQKLYKDGKLLEDKEE